MEASVLPMWSANWKSGYKNISRLDGEHNKSAPFWNCHDPELIRVENVNASCHDHTLYRLVKFPGTPRIIK